MTPRAIVIATIAVAVLGFFAVYSFRGSGDDSQAGRTPDPARSHPPGHPDANDAPRSRARSKPETIAEKFKFPPSVKGVLEALPARHFADAGAEGMAAGELESLLADGESQNWIIVAQEPRRLVIKPKHNNETTLELHTYDKGEDTVVLLETSHLRSLQTETWIYDSADKRVTQVDLLPEVPVTEFYSEADGRTIPEGYDANVMKTVRDDGTVDYGVWTFMEKPFEKIRPAFKVVAVWKGDRFEIRKTAVATSTPDPANP